MSYAGSTAPDGWLVCNGQEVSRTTYSKLFEVIGTTYGEGDGSTTFNVPTASDSLANGVVIILAQ
jgi:microcystin-dependent protein